VSLPEVRVTSITLAAITVARYWGGHFAGIGGERGEGVQAVGDRGDIRPASAGAEVGRDLPRR
jgi:hypothetical protein